MEETTNACQCQGKSDPNWTLILVLLRYFPVLGVPLLLDIRLNPQCDCSRWILRHHRTLYLAQLLPRLAAGTGGYGSRCISCHCSYAIRTGSVESKCRPVGVQLVHEVDELAVNGIGDPRDTGRGRGPRPKQTLGDGQRGMARHQRSGRRPQ